MSVGKSDRGLSWTAVGAEATQIQHSLLTTMKSIARPVPLRFPEIFDMILGFLPPPSLLKVTRVNTRLRRLLTNATPWSDNLWKNSRELYVALGLPGPPSDMSEYSYAVFLFGACGSLTDKLPQSYNLRIKLCEKDKCFQRIITPILILLPSRALTYTETTDLDPLEPDASQIVPTLESKAASAFGLKNSEQGVYTSGLPEILLLELLDTELGDWMMSDEDLPDNVRLIPSKQLVYWNARVEMMKQDRTRGESYVDWLYKYRRGIAYESRRAMEEKLDSARMPRKYGVAMDIRANLGDSDEDRNKYHRRGIRQATPDNRIVCLLCDAHNCYDPKQWTDHLKRSHDRVTFSKNETHIELIADQEDWVLSRWLREHD
ncbi:hypothetical protein M422DRAFT_55880 [Sphaerobolus stellatus SS14]|nr:hypothetical protein M422DRAFT_55880 [Sphaerobolus stellatus SS14]